MVTIATNKFTDTFVKRVLYVYLLRMPMRQWLISEAIFIVGFLFLHNVPGTAQPFSFYESSSKGNVFISGTSTLHDWDMSLDSFNCSVLVEKQEVNKLVLKNIIFKTKATNLKSGETGGSLMNSKAYDALKADEYPVITFTCYSTINVNLTNNSFQTDIPGDLTIAGVKKEVVINVKGDYKDGKLTVNGVYPITTSDFNVPTVTVFFGTLETGNLINVHFEIVLENKQNQ